MNYQAGGLLIARAVPDCLGTFAESGERLLRTSAVAIRIGRTPRMVRYLVQRARLVSLRKGKLLLFKLSDVEEYCRSMRVPS
jgi:hypothetical protein